MLRVIAIPRPRSVKHSNAILPLTFALMVVHSIPIAPAVTIATMAIAFLMLPTANPAMKLRIAPAVTAKTGFAARAATVVRWREIALGALARWRLAMTLQPAPEPAMMRRVSQINAKRPLISPMIARAPRR